VIYEGNIAVFANKTACQKGWVYSVGFKEVVQSACKFIHIGQQKVTHTLVSGNFGNIL
jgi:hypothetical protein